MEPLAEETKIGSQSEASSDIPTPADDKIQEDRKLLPIYEKKQDILKAICENLFVIVTGETGSGKTTQIPQYVVDDMRREDILAPLPEKSAKKYPFKCNDAYDSRMDRREVRAVVTQPRRVAAIQMAKRVAIESGCRLGGHVGYTIRFEDNSNPDTGIKYVTDGILVRE